MILDERTELADATALNTGAAGTYNVGDVIDTHVGSLNTTLNQGNGQPLYLVISVDTAIVLGSSTGTIQYKLVSDADNNPPSTTTSTVHYTSSAFATATTASDAAYTTAGSTPVIVALPHGSYERYLGLQQVTGTTAISAGKINAFLTLDPAAWVATADNVA